ncbi:MAG TPA: hypothetical protein VII76_00185 [Acidimicrobiales bacterium]
MLRSDEVMGEALGRRMGKPDGGLLLGRWSYQELQSVWNTRGGPYKDALMSAPKHVVSQHLFEPDNHVTELTLLDSTLTTKGVILATYQSS